MNRRFKEIILTSVCLLALSDGAYAQLQDNLEVNIFGGGSFYTRTKFEIGFPQSATPIQGTFSLSQAWRGGVRVGVYDRGHWSEEFFYSYDPSVAHFTRLSTPSRSSVNLGLSVNNYGITSLYYFHDDEAKHVRPFLSIGVGGTAYLLSSEAEAIARDPLRGNLPGISNSNLLSLNYGAGVKVRSSNWLGFRVDVRGFLGPNPSFGLAHHSDDPNAPVFPAGGALNNGEASAGLIFYFFNRR